MSKIKHLVAKFHKDEDGASFLEYTVLLGIILAVSIATVSAVGIWASGVWATLNTTLAASN